MSKRITIIVDDDILDGDAVQVVNQVIDGGKISGNNEFYCYCTEFKHPSYNVPLLVYTSERSKAPNICFTVRKRYK